MLDFGVAHRAGRKHLTRTGVVVGTPGYMAPEQAREHEAIHPIDARADVFALGSVLFECLTGVPAFGGGNAVDVLERILFHDAPRVRELWPEVPAALDALVAQMLTKNPAGRPVDGAELEAALAAIAPLVREQSATGGPREAQPAAITGGERRLRSVVLLGPRSRAAPGGAPRRARCRRRRARVRGGAAARDRAVRRAARAAGRGGWRSCSTPAARWRPIRRRGPRAARWRCAQVAGHRPIAIAMGRAEPAATLLEGDAIERASRGSSTSRLRGQVAGGRARRAGADRARRHERRPARRALRRDRARRRAAPVRRAPAAAGRADAARAAHRVRRARLGARRAVRDPRRVHRRARGPRGAA